MASPEELAFAGAVVTAMFSGFGFLVKWITRQFIVVMKENTRALVNNSKVVQSVVDVIEYCKNK